MLDPAASTPRPSLHYGWIVAGVTFFALLIGAAIRSVPGILIVPLEREFGWSRSAISAAVSINLLLYGLIGPFAAGFMNRFGVRRVVIFAFSVLACGVFSTRFVGHVWQLDLLWGVLVGVGTGSTALVMGATVINRWFHTHRGLLMGVLAASTATGQMIFLPVLASVTEHHGWRSATLIVAGAAALVVPAAVLLMRNDPADKGLRPYGLGADKPLPATVKRNPFHDAWAGLLTGIRSVDFWLLAGSFFVCGASTNGLVGTHLVPACMDHGIPEVRAAGLLAIMGIFDLVGTTISGYLSDRFSNRWLLFTYYGLRGLSLIYLPQAMGGPHDQTTLMVFAVFYGLDWIATVPPTIALTTKAFGRDRANIMFGWIFAAHQVGAATAAFGAGWLRTHEGFYDHAFLTSASLCIMTALAVLMIGRVQPQLPEAEPALA